MKMSITKNVYCRLCAELKPQNELTDMQTDEETCQKVINKLSRFNISMDFQENTLPKTVCLPCVTALETAFSFVTAVEQAQAFLSTLILVKSNTLNDVCDDITFFAQTEAAKEFIDIKIENRRDPMNVDNDETNFGEECDDDNVFNDDCNNICSGEINMENKMSKKYCFMTTVEEMNIKNETDINNVEENESLNFIENKYNKFNNVSEKDLNIKDTEKLSECKENLKRVDTEHKTEIPSADHKIKKKKYKGTKTKHKQPILKSVSTELDSTVHSEDYLNKQVNRLSVVPVQYLKKTWMDYEWKCSHCGTLFSNISELQQHSLQYHNVCNAYQCIDCKTRKQRLNAFIKHVRSHRKHLHYSCYKCFEKFPKMMETRQHKMKIHENSKYLCLGCNTPFRNNTELEEHVNKFYNILWRKTIIVNSDNLTCNTCHVAFANKTALRKHLMRHNKPNKRDHVCDRCGKAFDSQPTLRSHMDTHSERLLHICEICKTTFNSVYSLRYHASIHSGIKPFTCDVCSKCFRTKSQITNHMKFHSDYYPYPCTVCSKKFRTDCNLKNHMRQHTGAKPFSCDICQRDFTNLSNRNKHMRRRHGIEMAKKRQPIIKQLTPEETTSSDLTTEETKFTDLDKINEWKNKSMGHKTSEKANSKIRKVKVISKEWNEN